MRVLLISALLVIVSAFPSGHENNTHHDTAKEIRNQKSSVDKTIMMTLKEIDQSRKAILGEQQMTTKQAEYEKSFTDSLSNFFDSIFTAVRHPHIPFVSASNETVTERNASKIESLASPSSNKDLMTKTQEELKKDIIALRGYYFDLRLEIDEWVISNKHQNFKSMLIGIFSAVVVLIIWNILSKCCKRRTRNHLSAFVNDGFAERTGDNESLLSSKRNRRFPSNSEEDI